jgi:hypothetical protein
LETLQLRGSLVTSVFTNLIGCISMLTPGASLFRRS